MKKILYGAKTHATILLITCITFIFIVIMGCFGTKNSTIKAQNQAKTAVSDTDVMIQNLKFEDVFEKDKSIYAMDDEYNVKREVMRKLPYTHPDSFWVHYKHLLGLQPDMELRHAGATEGEGNKNTEANGFYYDLYYKELKVGRNKILFEYYKNLPSKIFLNLDTAFINGNVKNIVTRPKITPQQAIKASLKSIPPAKYVVNSISKPNDANFVAKLLLLKRSNKYVLSYLVRVITVAPFNGYDVYTDALNGKVILKECTTNYQCTPCNNEKTVSANILYYKNAGEAVEPTPPYPNLAISGVMHNIVAQDCDLGEITLKQSLNRNIVAYDAINNPPGIDYCYTNPNDPIAVTLNTFYWVVEECYDYFNNTHNWANFNGNGVAAKLLLILDGGNQGASGATNDSIFNISFGTGISPITPKVSLDAVTHEYVHAIINAKAAKPLQKKELGAIQEGICDVFGIVVEGQQIPIDWTVGETFLSPEVRNHKNPWASNPPQPKAYKGKNWFNEDQVVDTATNLYFIHHNNSILGYWFYLLSNGGIGNVDDNETPDKPYTVQGIGIDKAANIVFNSIIKLKGDPTFNFQKYCDKTIFIADSLYGSCSDEHVSVANAWYAVGVLPAKYNTALIAELN